MNNRLDQVLSVAQMRDAEVDLIDKGVSVEELMRRAGEGAAEWVWRLSADRSVTVLCGPGNNGGDGYVIAEWLRKRGATVQVVAPFEAREGAAAKARAAWKGDILHAAAGIRGEVFVDCLFGYGLSRGLDEDLQSLLQQLVENHHKRVAIDVPSGVESDSGTVLSPVPQYDLTLALGAWKPAHSLMPGRATMGRRELVDIGIESVEHAAELAERPCLSVPPADAHKYTRGLLAVVAGQMPGAAMLAAKAGMRAGAGYVKLLSDHSHPDAPAGLVVVAQELDEAIADDRIDALLIGPGLGRSDTARDRLACVIEAGIPAVLDADALHLLDSEMLGSTDASRILVTPHEGELTKLCDRFDVHAESKVERAHKLAETTGLAVLAKGADTLLVSPGRPTTFFSPASSWLSTAGTGDVLAGLSASRLAHHGDQLRAASEAVFLHSEAARLAGPALTADDLAETVSSAYARFL